MCSLDLTILSNRKDFNYALIYGPVCPGSPLLLILMDLHCWRTLATLQDRGIFNSVSGFQINGSRKPVPSPGECPTDQPWGVAVLDALGDIFGMVGLYRITKALDAFTPGYALQRWTANRGMGQRLWPVCCPRQITKESSAPCNQPKITGTILTKQNIASPFKIMCSPQLLTGPSAARVPSP